MSLIYAHTHFFTADTRPSRLVYEAGGTPDSRGDAPPPVEMLAEAQKPAAEQIDAKAAEAAALKGKVDAKLAELNGKEGGATKQDVINGMYRLAANELGVQGSLAQVAKNPTVVQKAFELGKLVNAGGIDNMRQDVKGTFEAAPAAATATTDTPPPVVAPIDFGNHPEQEAIGGAPDLSALAAATSSDTAIGAGEDNYIVSAHEEQPQPVGQDAAREEVALSPEAMMKMLDTTIDRNRSIGANMQELADVATKYGDAAAQAGIGDAFQEKFAALYTGLSRECDVTLKLQDTAALSLDPFKIGSVDMKVVGTTTMVTITGADGERRSFPFMDKAQLKPQNDIMAKQIMDRYGPSAAGATESRTSSITDKYDGKYASGEQMAAFQKEFPDVFAPGSVIDTAAATVFGDKANGYTDLAKAWEDPKFRQLIAKNIQETRASQV